MLAYILSEAVLVHDKLFLCLPDVLMRCDIKTVGIDNDDTHSPHPIGPPPLSISSKPLEGVATT